LREKTDESLRGDRNREDREGQRSAESSRQGWRGAKGQRQAETGIVDQESWAKEWKKGGGAKEERKNERKNGRENKIQCVALFWLQRVKKRKQL